MALSICDIALSVNVPMPVLIVSTIPKRGRIAATAGAIIRPATSVNAAIRAWFWLTAYQPSSERSNVPPAADVVPPARRG